MFLFNIFVFFFLQIIFSFIFVLARCRSFDIVLFFLSYYVLVLDSLNFSSVSILYALNECDHILVNIAID